MKRRILLKTFVACTALPVSTINASKRLTVTGSDAEGPFYPVEPIPVTGSLLHNSEALGDPLIFSGEIVSESATVLPGLRIDVWQCDANQAYNHPADRGSRDPNFRGFAAQNTDANGRFDFETIVPVAYAGRPPHIHVKIWRESQELLTTQIYLEGHRGNRSRKIRPVKADSSKPLYEAQFTFVV